MGKYINALNIYRTIVILFLTAAMSSAGWGLAQVVKMPEKYVQQHDLKRVTSMVEDITDKVGDIADFIACLPEKFPYKEDVIRRDQALEKKLDKLDDKINDLLMLQLGKKTVSELSDKHDNTR